MATCTACGRENRAEARFCDSCGVPLVVVETRELRKVVTILFCDVTGSTALGEKLDSESLRKVMERYFGAARNVMERHGGSVEKFIGDAVMAVFGIPAVHEDDALRAARAACELRERLSDLNVELRDEFGVELEVRIGINTGEVVTSEGGTLATGDAVNIAARLEQAAGPNEILIGERTRRLAEGALELDVVKPIEAKGKSDPVVAHRLLAVRADTPAFARRFDAPFVGREDELGQLQQAYARAVRDRACHLFTLLGAAGIGKSRLTHEFLSARRDAVVLRGRCLAYGEGITYFPLVEILEGLAADPALTAVVEREPQARRHLNRVAAAVGLAQDAGLSREDSFQAVRRLFETLARERPLIVVLDDLHWAEPTFQDLVDHLADWSREAPILLLCLARPELLDMRPGWGGGKLNATTTLLEPLSGDESERLMDNLLLGADLPLDLRRRIADTAEGNPLFVEQMLALIGEDGRDGDVEVPPTIQALLATRLEQLPTTERVAAERASVIGKEFWRTALVELGGEANALPALVRKELIRPHASPIFPSEDAFRFRHLLIRDAAYDAMPKELRADLHERFGRWLEHNRSEYDEIVAYHFEQAYDLREQLGPLDDEARALAGRAGTLLGGAGRRALERGDIPAAVNLLTRATSILPEHDELRLALLIELGYALQEAGELERSSRTFDATVAAAEAVGASALASRARIGRLFVSANAGATFTDPLAVVERELENLEERRDDAGLAEGWFVAGAYQGWLGHSEAAGEAHARAVEHARRAGNRRLTILPITAFLMVEAWGFLPADDGLRKCDALMAEHRDTSFEPHVRVARGHYLSLAGHTEEARREVLRAQEIYEEFGHELFGAGSRMNLADQELRAGRPHAAEAVAREGLELLEAFGEQGFRSTMAGLVAEALCRQGRLDEAEEYAGLVKAVAAEDDFEPQMRWRCVRARVLACRGEYEEAEALAREAVEIGSRTDWHSFHANALVDLAEVLQLAGKASESLPCLEAAIELYEQKGARVDADHVRVQLEQVRRP